MKLRKSLFLRTNHTSANGQLLFSIFLEIFEKEAIFSYSGNLFFNILHPASASGFFDQQKKYIFVRAILLLVETIIGIRSKQSKKELILASEQMIFQLVKIIFFLHFSETPAFFPFNGNVFFNEILHSGWWKRIFWLVETHFFCSEVFPSSGNRH